MNRSSKNSRSSYDHDESRSSDENEFSSQVGQEKIKQLAYDLLGRWHWIVLGLVLGILGSFYYLSKAPKIYQSTSTVLLKQETGSVMTKDHVDELNLKSEEAMNTTVAQILRPEFLLKVASRDDIRNLPGILPDEVDWLPRWLGSWVGTSAALSENKPATSPQPELLADAISHWTTIVIRKGTRLLDISVKHPNPAATKLVADALAIEYKAELQSERSAGRSTSVEILIKESDAARARLQVAKNAIASYERALTTLKDLEANETKLAELKLHYLPKHPKLKAAMADVFNFQRRFLDEFNAARNSPADLSFWQNHSEKEDLTNREIDYQLQTARRQLVARNSVLESEIESQTQVFDSVLKRIKESDINSQGSESEVKVSSLAALPMFPKTPQPPKILILGGTSGFLAGILIAFVLVRLDNKIHTVAQAERETGLPVLAAISDIQPKILNHVAAENKVDPSTIPFLKQSWDQRIVFREGISHTTFAEMFRVLRVSISLLGEEKKRKITLFSSALPGEGKSMISTNYAIASAQSGKRTILVDLDLRKPSVHKNFGLTRDVHESGASEVLAAQANISDAIYSATGEDNLDLMLAGKPAPNPGELLNAKTLEQMLSDLAKIYDMVVVDSAPLLSVPDTRLIIPLVDNFCLVTRAEYTPKKAIRRALELLDQDDNAPAGIVFNGFIEKRSMIDQNYTYGNYQTNRVGKLIRYGYGAYGAYGTTTD